VHPVVQTVPSAPEQARAAFPWIAFEGRWGELRPAFYNGPTGPNLKTQWTEPIRWSEGWRARSYTVPAGSAFGPAATGFFCAAIGGGSRALVRLVPHPVAVRLLFARPAPPGVRPPSRAPPPPPPPPPLPPPRPPP